MLFTIIIGLLAMHGPTFVTFAGTATAASVHSFAEDGAAGHVGSAHAVIIAPATGDHAAVEVMGTADAVIGSTGGDHAAVDRPPAHVGTSHVDAADAAAPEGHDHDSAAHLLHLCAAVLLALVVLGLALLLRRRPRILDLLPAPRGPGPIRQDRHPPPHGAALLNRLCVSLT